MVKKDKPRHTAHVAQVKGSAEDRSPRIGRQQGRFECPEDGGRESPPPRNIICFSCNERGHVARFCPRKRTTESCLVEQRPSDGVRRCYRCKSSRHLVSDCPSQVNELHANANCDLEEEEAQVNVCFVEHPQIEALATSCRDSNGAGVKCSSLQYVNVMVNDVNCVALSDLGAEVGVLSEIVAGKLGCVGEQMVQR